MQVRRRAVVPQGEDPAVVDELAVLYRQKAPAEARKLGEGAVDAIRKSSVDGEHKAAAPLFELFRGELGRFVLLTLVEEVLGPTKAALVVENEAEGERRFGVGAGLYGVGSGPRKRT